MNAALIKVAFANPPKAGKKLASIKTDEGAIFGVWPDKFGLFQPGRAYRVEFSTRSYQGKDYHTITKCEPADAASTAPGTAPAIGANGEQVFVTTILAAAVKACTVANTEQALLDYARMLRAVYRKTFQAA
jgi:hypothetical protein